MYASLRLPKSGGRDSGSCQAAGRTLMPSDKDKDREEDLDQKKTRAEKADCGVKDAIKQADKEA